MAPGLKLKLYPHQAGRGGGWHLEGLASWLAAFSMNSTPAGRHTASGSRPGSADHSLPYCSALQRAAVLWMQQREKAGGKPLPHPTLVPVLCQELAGWGPEAAFGAPSGPGLPLWLDTESGKLLTEPPPEVQDVASGLFCDDPGLGKTISAVCVCAGLWVPHGVSGAFRLAGFASSWCCGLFTLPLRRLAPCLPASRTSILACSLSPAPPAAADSATATLARDSARTAARCRSDLGGARPRLLQPARGGCGQRVAASTQP